jgi:hypothetical protein
MMGRGVGNKHPTYIRSTTGVSTAATRLASTVRAALSMYAVLRVTNTSTQNMMSTVMSTARSKGALGTPDLNATL